MYIVKTLRENESEINAHTFIFNNIDCLCEFLKTQDCFNEHYLKIERVINGNELIEGSVDKKIKSGENSL